MGAGWKQREADGAVPHSPQWTSLQCTEERAAKHHHLWCSTIVPFPGLSELDGEGMKWATKCILQKVEAVNVQWGCWGRASAHAFMCSLSVQVSLWKGWGGKDDPPCLSISQDLPRADHLLAVLCTFLVCLCLAEMCHWFWCLLLPWMEDREGSVSVWRM